MTRGERNNNPGNIRTVAGTVWQGQSPTQTDDAFVQFIDPVYGIRAIVKIFGSYEREGLNTLSEAIDRWAPPNENNSAAYVTAVCGQCNISPDTVVDFSSIMPQLVRAIIQHENGEVIYSTQQISDAISLS